MTTTTLASPDYDFSRTKIMHSQPVEGTSNDQFGLTYHYPEYYQLTTMPVNSQCSKRSWGPEETDNTPSPSLTALPLHGWNTPTHLGGRPPWQHQTHQHKWSVGSVSVTDMVCYVHSRKT